jgi:hypothetical protein
MLEAGKSENELEETYCCKKLVLVAVAVLDTSIEAEAHERVPEPLEADTSSFKPLQGPILWGAEIETTGVMGSSGTPTVKLCALA